MTKDMSSVDRSHQSDVILFCGPPHVGKTAYYHEKLADTYTRVSPVELSKANGDLSLRQLINEHVVAALRKGCRVVVDDENETRGRRASFIRVIKQKCPNARIECLSFHPSHGVAQLQWAQEFHNASCVERGAVDSVHSSDLMDRWEKWTDSPSDAEGILLTETRTNLRRKITPGLQVPALFVQWEAVVMSTDHTADVKLTDGVSQSLSHWYSRNPCGRIIVICDGITTRGGDRNRRVTQSLAELARHMTDCPIYLVSSDEMSGKGSFCLPPQPGILAFLIQLHHVDIESKATMYLYKSTSHMTMAANAGVPYVKASRVFQHPLLVKSDHAATKPPLPSVLRDIQTAEDTTVMLSPSVPLYEAGMAASDGICHVKLGCWRSLYLGCKDKTLLRRYNRMFKDLASRRTTSNTSSTSQMDHNASVSSTNNVSPATRSRNLPSWMLTKSDKKTPANKDSALQRGGETSSPSLDASTIYVMNEEELLNAARQLLQQVDARGEGTVETPGVQRTNIITAADKEVIAREGHAETTVAHDVTATSRADETKLTSDQEDDQTTAAIDDMFGLDLVHRRKPPSRVRNRRSDLEATGTGTVRPSSLARDVTTASGHVSPSHGVFVTPHNIVHTSTVHRFATTSVEIGQISPGRDLTTSSSKTLQLQQETFILPSTVEHKTTRSVYVDGERGFLGSGRKGERADVRAAACKRTVDPAGMSRNSDIESTERAKRRRLSPDLSLLDDLF